MPAFLLPLVAYTLAWALFRVDCGEGLGRWHLNYHLQHSHVAMCDEASAVEILVRALT